MRCDFSSNEEKLTQTALETDAEVGASTEFTVNFLSFKNAKHTNAAPEFSYCTRPRTSRAPGGVAQKSEPRTFIVLLWDLHRERIIAFDSKYKQIPHCNITLKTCTSPACCNIIVLQ